MCGGRRQPGLTADRVKVTRPLEPDRSSRNQPIYPQLADGAAWARAGRICMPLLRYFLFVGGSLLALLLLANLALPTIPLSETLHSGSDLPPVRIHSEQKLPDRVVFDTSISPTTQAPATPVAIAQVQPKAQATVAPESAAISAKARVREAFAQLPEEDVSKPKTNKTAAVMEPERPAQAQPKRKLAAKPRPAPRPMMIAQQPRFGGFFTW